MTEDQYVPSPLEAEAMAASNQDQPATPDTTVDESSTEDVTVESDSKGFIPVPGNEGEGDVSDDETAEAHDDTDVEAALARTTSDGSGLADGESVPKSDFEGYADDDVEEDA